MPWYIVRGRWEMGVRAETSGEAQAELVEGIRLASITPTDKGVNTNLVVDTFQRDDDGFEVRASTPNLEGALLIDGPWAITEPKAPLPNLADGTLQDEILDSPSSTPLEKRLAKELMDTRVWLRDAIKK